MLGWDWHAVCATNRLQHQRELIFPGKLPNGPFVFFQPEGLLALRIGYTASGHKINYDKEERKKEKHFQFMSMPPSKKKASQDCGHINKDL